jgi:hypothetical protein
MIRDLRRWALLAVVCATSLALGGCLISGISGGTINGLFSGQATTTLQGEAPCTPNTTTHTTSCDVLIHAQLSSGLFGIDFPIDLVGWDTALTLWDPLIVQVPASMSNFAGSIAVGPPGVAVNTPLDIIAGLTSVPIDAKTNLVAEPGMQLVIIDFQSPTNVALGTYTLKFQFSGTTSSIKVLFAAKITAGAKSADGAKAAQTYYVPIYPCVSNFASVSPITLPLGDLTQLAPLVLSAAGQGCAGKTFDFAGLGSGSTEVVEYYNASLDHYFITWVPGEIVKLDAGTVIKGWVRTGKTLKTYTAAQTGTSPVCRFYIPPGLGDSHFFGRGTAECNSTGTKNPSFVLEDPAFMQMFLPTLGVCPANTSQIYRVFSNRPDANHRYMTSKTVRDQMVTKGWLAEGDGPDLVVMCAPQ